MYKDKEKQRGAVRLATQRYRKRLKAIADRELGITQISYTSQVVIPIECESVIPLQSHNSMMVGYVPPTD